ncbi:long-chain acyl-CoA synthetase [Branchiibius hedensis]|uniref:Long-chain acyl-CoA synthetase n=1 Tax=Branchiibius hedensis TaxID=672460 RepID=A0A2Y8ZXM3_9MICO|nr:AMP-binding protein [Branchiibius hedensis]PWJ25814.1 long-chain acyl-CoA synthetase [Branchiibius hedensis]SSA34627.1 long-chain acyl-CoA synthetase [Branchiibius hedensis]
MFEDRPWLSSYSQGVPADVEIPLVLLDGLLRQAAQRWPDRVAVDFFGASTTYRELDAQVDRAAAGLRQLGVTPGTRVSLVMPNCTAHIVAFYAVLRCGAAVVEHNPTYTTAELHDQLGLTGSRVVLVWRNRVADVQVAAQDTDLQHIVSVDVARDLPRKMQLLLRLPVKAARSKRAALTGGPVGDAKDWADLVRTEPGGQPSGAQEPTDEALVLFTGGTTGVPKGASITHYNLVANATQGTAWAGFQPGAEVVCGVLPFFHAFGMIFCVVLPPLIGATLVAFPNFDPPAVVAGQKRAPYTFMPAVAPMFSRILDAAGGVSLGSIKQAFCGAMPLDAATADRWEQATGGLLIEGYGSTETSPIVLGNPASEKRRRGALGIPFPNTEIRVVDPDDQTVEATANEAGVVRGELLVRGPQVFAGYVDRPEETANVLSPDGWLRTGDVVEVDRDGFAVLVDRTKEIIIVGGFKVFPTVVEEHLRELAGVDDVAVVGVPRGAGGDEEVVAVVVSDGQPPTLDQVREHAAQRLAKYAVPRHLHIVEELPRSMIGKVQRRLVRDDVLKRNSDS